MADIHTRLVIFGATGDLTARLLLHAVAHLRGEDALPDNLTITGVADQDWDTARFRDHVGEALAEQAWRIMQPIVDAWADDVVVLRSYPAGTTPDW